MIPRMTTNTTTPRGRNGSGGGFFLFNHIDKNAILSMIALTANLVAPSFFA